MAFKSNYTGRIVEGTITAVRTTIDEAIKNLVNAVQDLNTYKADKSAIPQSLSDLGFDSNDYIITCETTTPDDVAKKYTFKQGDTTVAEVDVGNKASINGGGAVGNDAYANSGGAVGDSAKTGDGFAGGDHAKTIDDNGNGIDAIQLGAGTNPNSKTLQVYDYTMMNEDGTIPHERIPYHYTKSETYNKDELDSLFEYNKGISEISEADIDDITEPGVYKVKTSHTDDFILIVPTKVRDTTYHDGNTTYYPIGGSITEQIEDEFLQYGFFFDGIKKRTYHTNAWNKYWSSWSEIASDKVDYNVFIRELTEKVSVDEIENKADKSTTLAGYGIQNAYTKTEIDELLSNICLDNLRLSDIS